MTVPNGDILTNLMTSFTAITANSTNLIHGYAVKALITLITIDIIIVALFCLMENQDIAKTLLRRTIKYGAFSYMVMDYKNIINALGDSFVLIGLKAAGDTLTAKIFTNPSQITDMGFNMIMPFVQNMTNGKSFGASGGDIIDKVISLPTVMLLGLTYILILFCFFAIAINIFVVYIEFAILTSIGLILVPFGVWDQTSFIFDKIKNGIITFGIKFMTLAFVVSISFNLIKSWQLPTDPTFQQALYVLVGMLAIAYLCHHAPSVAAGIASGGGGSMTGAAMGGFAGAALGKAASVGSTTHQTGKSVGGLAKSAIMGRSISNPTTGQSENVGGLFGKGGVFNTTPPTTTAAPKTATDKQSSTPPSPSGVNMNATPAPADTGTDTGTATNTSAPTAATSAPTPTASGTDLNQQPKTVGSTATPAQTPDTNTGTAAPPQPPQTPPAANQSGGSTATRPTSTTSTPPSGVTVNPPQPPDTNTTGN